MTTKTILDLTYTEARAFFLKEENYFTFELPDYFTFALLLQSLSSKLEESNLSDYYISYIDLKTKKQKILKPASFENVNYKLLNNKDGEYDWRLFQLIHPALYVSLVHKITEKENWEILTSKFKEFKNTVIKCSSLPIIKSEEQKSKKAEQILLWWEEVEQQSLNLALEYDYIFHADIVDCYGTIYTHSIPWALHTKPESKKSENRNNDNLIGVVIDKSLQAMSNGQTNGIPQGSILMDFIAEIVLGYVDQELTRKIKSIPSDEYKIIRYRDDYRVFVNNPEFGKVIIKELSNVLSEIGMRLNSAKTKYLNDVISGSIKSDKLFWITNCPVRGNFEKQLLVLYEFSKKYPNSGTLAKELQFFYKRIEGKIKKGKSIKNVKVLISILMNIVFKNPRNYPISAAILSKLLDCADNESKKEIIEKIKKRFQKLPNTEHLNLWLQRITLKIDNSIEFQGKLCQKVSDDSVILWDSDWLKDELRTIISYVGIIDQEKIKNMAFSISKEEVIILEQKKYY